MRSSGLVQKLSTAVLEIVADVVVEALEALPQLQFLVTRKVYQRSVHKIMAKGYQPRVIDPAPLFTASALDKCNDPACDICRPRTGLAN